MKYESKFISILTACTLLTQTAFAGTYTVSFIDSATNNLIKESVVNTSQTGSNISYSTDPSENGYHLDHVEVNGNTVPNFNGNISIDNIEDVNYNINYIFKDTEPPILSLRETPYYIQNAVATDPKQLLEVCTDNSGTENINLVFKNPVNVSSLGMKEFTIVATDRSKNETTISGMLEIVGSARLELKYTDVTSKREIRLPYIKGLMLGSSEVINVSAPPKGYNINSIKIDNKDIGSTASTFILNDIKDKIYNVSVEYVDVEKPTLKLKAPLVFTKKEAINYANLVEVNDNSLDIVNITGNIDTTIAGIKKQATITATDKAGNSTTLNIVYDVLSENYYTLKSIDFLTNTEISANAVTQKFSVGDTINISIPEILNGYKLLDVVDSTGKSYQVLNNTLSINSEDRTYNLIAKYKDIMPPTGSAKYNLTFGKGETIIPSLLVTDLFDNSGVNNITVTYLTSVDTTTIGNKIASIILTDKSGNSSLPISISYNVVNGVNGEKISLQIKYIDYNTDDLIDTQNITTYYGNAIDETDLKIPNEYRLRDKDWRYVVNDDDSIKVYIEGKTYTITIRFTNIYNNNVINRQYITGLKGDKITETDLNIPNGYYLKNNSFNKAISLKDEIIDIKVTSNENEENDTVNNKDYKMTITYYEDTISNIVNTQVIYKNKNDSLTKNDLELPNGYELASDFKTAKITSQKTFSFAVKKSSKIINCQINYVCNDKIITTDKRDYILGTVIPEKDLSIPEGFELKNKKDKIEASSVTTIELDAKIYLIHLLSETPENSTYSIPEYSDGKKYIEFDTKKMTDILSKEFDALGTVLKTYGNDIYIVNNDSWVVGSNIINFEDTGLNVKIPLVGTHIQYIAGYNDKTIQAENPITRAEAAGMLNILDGLLI